jgi:hypothetical protein
MGRSSTVCLAGLRTHSQPSSEGVDPDHAECKLPTPTTFPSSTSGVLKIVVGRKPIVTDDPTDTSFLWLHDSAAEIQFDVSETCERYFGVPANPPFPT